MERKTFIRNSCACGLASFLPMTGFSRQIGDQDQTPKKSSAIDMSEKQVQEILKFIDTSFDYYLQDRIRLLY